MMENLPAWLTWPNVLIVVAALEAFVGALPNAWIPYKSKILRILGFLDEL